MSPAELEIAASDPASNPAAEPDAPESKVVEEPVVEPVEEMAETPVGNDEETKGQGEPHPRRSAGHLGLDWIVSLKSIGLYSGHVEFVLPSMRVGYSVH